MKFGIEQVIGIIFIVLYLAFAITWVLFVTRRMRPWARHKLEDSMGVSISERFLSRTQVWEIKGAHTWRQGCLVEIVHMGVEFGCLVLPLFAALGLMGAIMILLSD